MAVRATILYIIILSALCGCRAESRQKHRKEHFTAEVRLKTTPVKDQGGSSLCWAYAMLATIETEHLMQGDSVNLSPDYVARMFLREQACERIVAERQGAAAQASGEFTTRGVGTMLLRLIQTYGLQHYDAYHRNEDCDYNILARRLNLAARKSGRAADVLEDVDGILDDVIAPLPPRVYMRGAEYTPLEFTHSVCRSDEYVALTSFSHHPFGSRFALEVPDNRYHDTFLNVPVDTLMARIEGTLRSGHPVFWEGDTSEPGFDFARGVARLRDEASVVTQEHRQFSFETGRTTDDHCMEIVGIARDGKGRKYFICKNSWGADNPYGGFMYLSENYVKLKTVAAIVPVGSEWEWYGYSVQSVQGLCTVSTSMLYRQYKAFVPTVHGACTVSTRLLYRPELCFPRLQRRYNRQEKACPSCLE